MSGPRRALIVVENESVPHDQRVWREATTLTDAGWAVSVICPRGAGRDDRRHETIDGIEIHRFTLSEAGEGVVAYVLEYGLAVAKILWLMLQVRRRRGFDVVQLCNPPDVLFAAALPFKLFGARVIFDHHDLSPELWQSRGGSPVVHRALLWAERATFAVADVVMSTNRSYRGIAIERGRMDPADVFVVRNGPDLDRLVPAAPDPSLRNGRDHLLGYVGTMGPQDGVDYMIRALEVLVHKQGRDVQAVLVGDGPELDSLRSLAAELGLADHVTFTGRVPPDRVAGPLSSADVCVCPDPRSPLNEVSTMIKTLEYMALGKPIAAFDLVETRVSAGDAAVYATGDEPEDLADAIGRLLDDDGLRERIAQSGRSRVEDGLTWKHSEPELLAAYDRSLTT
jgi:glycosyltransferase involved in cell wall biosynthesis